MSDLSGLDYSSEVELTIMKRKKKVWIEHTNEHCLKSHIGEAMKDSKERTGTLTIPTFLLSFVCPFVYFQYSKEKKLN